MTAAPTDQSRVDYYQDYWRNAVHEDNVYLRWKAAVARAHPVVRAASSVLDVGCGPGAVLAALEAPRARLCGVEMSEEAARTVTSRGFEGRAVDLEKGVLPYDDGTFDVVLCFDVLEHLFSPGLLLSEIKRVLAPGGLSLLCVPNTLNAYNRWRFARGTFVDIMDTSHHEAELFSNHIRLFSKNLFERFLSLGGFTIERRHFYFPSELTDPTVRVPPAVGAVIRAARLPERLPSLFALAFLYECRNGS